MLGHLGVSSSSNNTPVLCTGTPGLILREAARLALHLPLVSQGSQRLRNGRKGRSLSLHCVPCGSWCPLRYICPLYRKVRKVFARNARGEIIKFTLRPLRFLVSFALHLPFVSQGSQSFRNGRKGRSLSLHCVPCGSWRPLRYIFLLHRKARKVYAKGARGRPLRLLALRAARKRLLVEPPLSICNSQLSIDNPI